MNSIPKPDSRNQLHARASMPDMSVFSRSDLLCRTLAWPHSKGIHRSVNAAHPPTLSPCGEIVRVICSAQFGPGRRRSFQHPWHTAATTPQTPSVGGCHPKAGRPEPARGLQGAANEIRQTLSPCSHLIATLPTTPICRTHRTAARERLVPHRRRLSFCVLQSSSTSYVEIYSQYACGGWCAAGGTTKKAGRQVGLNRRSGCYSAAS
jgi:hypothetical protein